MNSWQIHSEFKYPRGKLSFNLLLKSSELVVLSGENGSGKSSFFHFLKMQKNYIFKNNFVGFVDQLPLAPLGSESLSDIIQFMQSEYNALFDHNISNQFLSLFNMHEFIHIPISRLSGGQNQLAKLLLCFSFKHHIFVCDEPFQYLDKARRTRLANFFQEQVKQQKALIVIDHLNIFPAESVTLWTLEMSEQGGRIHA